MIKKIVFDVSNLAKVSIKCKHLIKEGKYEYIISDKASNSVLNTFVDACKLEPFVVTVECI